MLQWLKQMVSGEDSSPRDVDKSSDAADALFQAPPVIEPGVLLSGRYRLDRKIGKGGAASVYQATDLALGHTVAAKILHPEVAERFADDDSSFNLRSEAVAAMRLAHPLVARVHNYDQDGDFEYLIMEYVPGKDLQSIRRSLQTRRFGLDLAVHLGKQILSALDYAHQQGVVHNDIKPRNVLMDENGALKVCDFGLARLKGVGDDSSGPVAGTVAYMPPEVIQGHPSDHRADLYSVAASIYELVSGRAPFGKKRTEAFIGHLKEQVPRSKYIPEALYRVLAKAMAKDPQDRYQSAADMVTALDGVLKGRQLLQTAGISEVTEDELEPIAVQEAAPAPVQRKPAAKVVEPLPEDMSRITRRVVHVEGRSFEVAPFAIDKFPVTQAQYAAFVAATGAVPPAHWPGREPRPDERNHPVTGVTWQQATAYAAWKGRRLPTTLEWVATARGEDNRKFPWGQDCDQTACQCSLHKPGETSAVDAHPGSATPEGVEDLLGNTWEWTAPSEGFSPGDKDYRYVMGGSYRHSCSAAQGRLPRTQVAVYGEYTYLGFRCARDVEE